MLQVDLRELSGGPATTHAELRAADPLLEGLGVVLAGPVQVTGRLHAAGEGRFYWQGSLRAQIAGECRRCLVPVPVAGPSPLPVLFTQGPRPPGGPGCDPPARGATELRLPPPPPRE